MIKPEKVPYQDAILMLGVFSIFLLAVGFIGLSQGESEEPAAEEINITIEPTPIPVVIMDEAPKLPYDLWKYKNKQYNLSEWHTIRRDDVSGYQDLVLMTTVYRVIEMPNYYTWEWNWGGPTDGSADWANVPKQGNKFVFVWVCEYINGSETTNDPIIYGLDGWHFALQLDGKLYRTLNYQNGTDLVAPIREFENLYDLSNTTRTEAFGIKRVQQRVTGKITAYEMSQIRMGRSNAWDGWLMFEVPRNADVSKAIVIGDFRHLGAGAHWTVTPMFGY